VDINPGDRAADCGGMMEPVSVETKAGEYIITHQCLKCGNKKKNKTVETDEMDKIIEISN